MPSSMASVPMAVGTHPGYRTCRCTPVPSVSNDRLSVKALTAAFDAL